MVTPKSVKLTLSTIVYVAVTLPAASILGCILISLWLHGNKVNATHCKVPNYLPSISAAVGNSPETFIWRICIGLHSTLRFFIAFIYYKFYNTAAESSSVLFIRPAVKLNSLFHLLEVFCLVLLADVSSIENYEIHKSGFIGFVVFSLLYMLLTCWLYFKLGEIRYNKKNYRSFRLKVIFLLICFVSLFLAGYFFWRHNTYCEPGVYSLFSFFEYILVFSNIAFHWTAVYDFTDVSLEVLMNSVQYSGLKKGLMDF